MLQTRLCGVVLALCLCSASAPLLASSSELEIRRSGPISRLEIRGHCLHETTATILDPLLQELPGGGRLIRWRERGAEGERSRYALDPKGQGFLRVRELSSELALRRGLYHPVPGEELEPGFASEAGELHLIQFVCPPTPDMLAAIEALGVKLLQPVPENARIARFPAARRGVLQAQGFVRWIGRYAPELRLEPELQEILEGGAAVSPVQALVQATERGIASKSRIAARIAELGGRTAPLREEGFLLEAWLPPGSLLLLAAHDEVLWIERDSAPEGDLALVRGIGGATYLEGVAGYRGAGVAGEVVDDNLRETHQAFQGKPFLFHGPRSGATDHGTQVAGCLFGDGTGMPSARGILPAAQPIFADYHHLTNRYAHTAALLAPPYQAVFQSNSWGHGSTTQYGARAVELDDLLFHLDITVLHSQGNTGSQLSRAEAWAKNSISVGGVRHFDSWSLADDAWAGSGSIGPAADGRVKPDLVFFYDAIQTTHDQHDAAYTNAFSGTSAATPCVAGYVGLVQELWADGLFGNQPQGTSVFERRARAATVRALMVNSARSYAFHGSTHDLGRFHQGWGLPDVQRLHELRERTFVVDEERRLAPYESVSYALEVLPGEPEFRATLAWRDLPGIPSAARHRVNDLSLRVHSPDGKSFWGNHGLLTGNHSQPGGSSNTTDVIENVFLPSPAPGTWIVEVIADELQGDGDPSTPELDTAFALVVSGVLRPASIPAPTTYCQAKPHSQGGIPAIGWSGSPSLSAGGFAVELHGALPHQPALLFAGSGPAELPMLGGTLCLQPPFQRILPALLDATGAGRFPVDTGGLLPGATAFYQLWFRDPLDPTGHGVGLSEGLSVSFGP